MGKTRIGSSTSTYKVGSSDCKIYLGSELVYPEATQKNYLAFTATESGTFSFTRQIEYSIDNGISWRTLPANTPTSTIDGYSKILWRAELTPNSTSGVGTFSSTGKFSVRGNPMSLLFGDNFENVTSLSGKNYAFKYLFKDSKVTGARSMDLVATTLSQYCYEGMFSGCSNLTYYPLTLPATTLTEGCYANMFEYCTSLTNAPVLPATTLASSCYSSMFRGCTSLTNAPVLPATTLANSCYHTMFNACTYLRTAPVLPATTLAQYCYYGMFSGCSNLNIVPSSLPATTLENNCYGNMFDGCTSLTIAPELPAPSLTTDCYSSMFQGCTSLAKITCLALNPNTSYTAGWVNGVPTGTDGTFIKHSSAREWTQCDSGSYTSGIPCGWTVRDN